jgi:putative ABC transport system permease protein
MNTSSLLSISIKALFRNPFRTFLTMLGIIIGVASVIAMLGIGQGSKQSIQSEISGMGSNMLIVQPGRERFRGAMLSSAATETLTLDDYEAIRDQTKYIQYVSPMVSGGGQLVYSSKNWPTSLRGVSPEYAAISKYEIREGTMFTQRDVKTAAKVCVIGQTVIDNLFEKDENPLGKTIRFNSIPFKVVGVMKEKGQNTMGMDMDDIVLTPYTTVQKRVLAITHLNGIFASAVSEESADEAKEEIETLLRRQHGTGKDDTSDFEVRSQQELIDVFGSITDILTILLGAIAGISLVVGGIGIMNIMMVSVTERTREIGLRMSVGGMERDIMLQFLIESVMISLTGGILGISLGLGLSWLVESFMSWPVYVTTWSILISFAVSTAIGVFFGWYPARKASALDPIEALRYE